MRHLFLRIFLAFWAAMAAVVTASIVSSPMFTRSRPAMDDRMRREAEGALLERLDHFASAVARGEPERFGPPHEGQPPRGGEWVLTPAGEAVDGPEPPPEIAAFARRVSAAGEQIAEREGASHMVGRPVTGPDGGRRVAIVAVRRPPGLADLFAPGVLGWRLALLTVVVGGVCLWLAWTLTAPVAALRGAARQLTGGDLTTRVPPEITRRHDEIGDLARDFDAMAARLEVLIGAQRRLVRDVSHELRSPLARLSVALELARRKVGDAGAEELDRIELEAERLEALVGQLLTLSRLEAGEAGARLEPLDLAALVAAVAADAEFEATANGVSVTVDAPEACTGRGDEDALRSAVENVIRNAVHFTSPGSAVEVRLAVDGTTAVLSADDRGPGAPEESLPDLFEPFFRVEEARQRSPGGAGVGLAIAARIVELHGGTISARNREGGGLEVAIRLPLHHPARG